MKTNNLEKINQINNDRIILLNNIKNSLKENNENVLNSLDKCLTIINIDEKNTKEYTSILEAKDIIESLILEINKANSIDEIKNIRNKLNYYINKVKEEIKKRNINENLYNQYYNNVSYLRKDISKYIRYIKRENNISEITRLINLDNISDEENEQLKRLIRNELAYNKRNLIEKENLNDNNEFIIENNNIPTKDITEFDFSSLFTPEKKENCEFILNIDDIEHKEEKKNDIEKISGQFKTYNNMYKIEETYEYNDNIVMNIINLLRNIPKYIKNKRKISWMLSDYYCYYKGKNLNDYINYSRNNNSILNAIKNIFKNTRLNNRENECLNNHNLCTEYILNTTNNNSFSRRKIR